MSIKLQTMLTAGILLGNVSEDPPIWEYDGTSLKEMLNTFKRSSLGEIEISLQEADSFHKAASKTLQAKIYSHLPKMNYRILCNISRIEDFISLFVEMLFSGEAFSLDKIFRSMTYDFMYYFFFRQVCRIENYAYGFLVLETKSISHAEFIEMWENHRRQVEEIVEASETSRTCEFAGEVELTGYTNDKLPIYIIQDKTKEIE